MWLLTNFGFFSVVQKPGDADLTVRARVREDLEILREKYLPALGEITGGGTDYAFRARVPHEEFAEAARKIALEIDYDNFKNSVRKRQGSERAKIYGKVWSTLLELQR